MTENTMPEDAMPEDAMPENAMTEDAMTRASKTDLSVERLCRRVASIPGVFVEARPKGHPRLATRAIVHDMILTQTGESLTPRTAGGYRYKRKRSNADKAALSQRLFLTRVVCWLLADDAFRGQSADALRAAIDGALPALEVVAARQFVEDADRREELVRMTLAHLNLAPAGETKADAEDRLSALDSVQRVRLLQEARAAEEARRKREAELAAELAKKRAAEQAARYDREY